VILLLLVVLVVEKAVHTLVVHNDAIIKIGMLVVVDQNIIERTLNSERLIFVQCRWNNEG